MKMSDSGYVLLTVLVFLQMLTALAVLGLFSVKLSMMSVHDVLTSDQRLSSALHVLHNLERSAVQMPDCQRPILQTDWLVRQSDEWWQAQACQPVLNARHYAYLWESLSTDICALIKKHNIDQILISKYARVTLHVPAADARQGGYILQSTIVTAVPSGKECTGQAHWVNEGRQSLRLLQLKEI